jgi:hypothetical protein
VLPLTLTLTACAFTNDSARYFGALYRRGSGPFDARAANFTDTAATECVGCLEAGRGDVALSRCVVLRSSARAHNGALCTRSLDSLVVLACVFDNCSHRSRETEAAACVLAYENPPDSGVADTDFVGSGMDGAWTVTVASGSEMIVAHCRFSGAKERELGLRLVVDGCVFGAVVGETETPRGKWTVVRKKRKKNQDAVYGAAAGIAAVVALALTGAQALLHHGCKGTMKVPKAIQ